MLFRSDSPTERTADAGRTRSVVSGRIRFFGAPSGDVQVTAEADGDAGIAARQVVDEAGRGKAFDVGAVFLTTP